MEPVTYGDRVRFALDARGKTRKELAERLGISVQAVGDVINGKSHSFNSKRHSATIAWLQISDAWLQEGVGEMDAPNVREGPGQRRPLPVISWVQAGAFADVEDNYHPGEADEWFTLYETNVGPHAFVLIVEGDSMISPTPGDRLSFPPDTRIVVDPDMGARAGDFVVAKHSQTGRATFKKLHFEDGAWYLKPLNPAYKLIPIDDLNVQVIGKVTDFYTGGKL